MPGRESSRPTRRGSSSASTRPTEPARRAVGRGSGLPSPATSSRATAARSGWNPTRAVARRCRSRSRSRMRRATKPARAMRPRPRRVMRPRPKSPRDRPRRRGRLVADRLVVATLNIRNIADRWGERMPLLLGDMAALQPDLIGLQECVFAVQQDRILGAAGEGHYASRRGWAGRPEYGNAILGRKPLRLDEGDRLDLGHNRSALRVPVTLPSKTRIDFVVTHLHHEVEDEAIRAAQAANLTAWLADISWPLVVVGDFNAEPVEPTYAHMVEAGFRSAHAEANGAEPAVTWPSG